MTKKHILVTVSVLLLVPQTAMAYLNPEDVLLNRELFMPPTARESQMRTNLQAEEAAARREREQQAAFAEQHPEEPEVLHQAAPEPGPVQNVIYAVPVQGTSLFQPAPSTSLNAQLGGGSTGLDAANMELLRTMRLLSRVNNNQNVMIHGAAGVAGTHAGAPLAPTGAGAIATAITMAGAVGWTAWRLKKSNRVVC